VCQNESNGALFTIPITSLSGFDEYVGASFIQYVTPSLFVAGLNESEAQIGSAVVAAQVRLPAYCSKAPVF
jgi:hypothetical protein